MEKAIWPLYKIDYVIVIKSFLNPEGHQNPISVSKVTAILLKGWILPIGGVAWGRVCACSLRSRLVFKASALWADAFYKSKCPYVYLSVCLSVCQFTFEVPFNGLFAPTSRSRMSNIFRDSESLGKSNGKKWSHIWTFSFGSGLKSPLILPYKTW